MMARLEEICAINMGQSPDSSTYNEDGNGLPFFQGNADFGEIYPAVRMWCSEPTKIAREKDILISVRAPIGALNIANCECCIGRGLAALTVNEDICAQEYLWHVLSGKVDELNSKGTGSTFKAINKKTLSETEIPLPPIDEQRKIAAVLDKVSGLIAKRRQQLDKLDEMVKARFMEIFGDPVTNPKGWKIDQLGSYMTTLTDFSANGSYELLDSNVVMYDEPNYAVMVRTIDLEAGNLDNGVKYIDQKAYELLSKSKLYGGELIMNKIGSAGKIYIMPHIGKPASLGRNAFMFRFDERINMVFLYALLTSDYGTVEIQQYVRGAVTKTITKASTKAIRIIVPPIELQNRFATFVEQTEKTKLIISHSLEKLETLKKALMQEYFG